MNVYSFSGNLGRDADQKFLPDGTSIVSFSVAVKSGYGDKESTTWPKCTMFGKRGEGVFPYLKTGSILSIISTSQNHAI